MHRGLRVLAISMVVTIAACGGGASGGSPSSNGIRSSAPTAPAGASPSSVPTTAGLADACAMLTAVEVGGLLKVSSTINLAPNNGDTGDVIYCVYTVGGHPVLATSYKRSGGATAFGGWKSNTGVQDVTGIGDDAVWIPTSSTLYILKGNVLASIDASGATTLTPDARLILAKAAGALVAGRI